MAKIISAKNIVADEVFEPGLKIERGIHPGTVENPKMVMGHTIIPPGARNQRHYHVKCDAGMYVLKGKIRMFFGPDYSQQEVIVEPGDFIFIPQGEIHGLMNLSDKEAAEIIFCIGGLPEDLKHYKEESQTIKIEPPWE